jgi:hypothetical protein
MGESLTNLGSQRVTATENTNVTGQLTSILDLEPVDGLRLVLSNLVYGGAGIPIYAVLQDSGGNDLPLDTELALRWYTPSLDQPQVVSEIRRNIRPYRTLTLNEQQNEEYREQVRTELKNSASELVVTDIERLEVAINSSAQIDWANSRLAFDRKAVDIVAGE